MSQQPGDPVSIREVYSLVEGAKFLIDKSKTELMNEMREHNSRMEAAVTRLTTVSENTATRLQAHVDLPHHPQTANELTKIRITLAKYAGGLAVLGVLLSVFVKFLP